jgi:hypothetical protein
MEHRFADSLAHEVSRAFIPPCTCRDFSPANGRFRTNACKRKPESWQPTRQLPCAKSSALVDCSPVIRSLFTIFGAIGRDARFWLAPRFLQRSDFSASRASFRCNMTRTPGFGFPRNSIPARSNACRIFSIVSTCAEIWPIRPSSRRTVEIAIPALTASSCCSHQRSCCLDLTRDYKHRSPCPGTEERLSAPILSFRSNAFSVTTLHSPNKPT